MSSDMARIEKRYRSIFASGKFKLDVQPDDSWRIFKDGTPIAGGKGAFDLEGYIEDTISKGRSGIPYGKEPTEENLTKARKILTILT